MQAQYKNHTKHLFFMTFRRQVNIFFLAMSQNYLILKVIKVIFLVLFVTSVKRIENENSLNTHTYVTCRTAHSTKQQFHQLPPIPNRWSLGKTGKLLQGSHWAVPSLPMSVHSEYSTGQWYHLLNMKPKYVLKGRNSSNGQHRYETSMESVAVQ